MQENKMKILRCLVVIGILMSVVPWVVMAGSTQDRSNEIPPEFQNRMSSIINNPAAEYNPSLASSVSAEDLVEIGGKWYCLKKGDLLFYKKKGFEKFPGHIGMYSGNGKFIDAYPFSGVKRYQPIEDSRFDTSATKCYRVKTAQKNRTDAVGWAEGKHGESYNLWPPTPCCDTCDEWYCSELVYCAYKEQGITLGEIGFGGWVWPESITLDSDVESVPSTYSLDLIFTIDTTGSMWDDIDKVKASATIIVDAIAADIPCYRIAVVDYRDFPVDPYGGAGDYPFNDVLSFSTDKSTIVAAIQSLTLGWGNDWEESVYSGLMHSIDSTSLGGWRGSDQAAKVIILMGDAPPHDPEPFTGYTLSSVVTAAENADPVIIYPIQIGGIVEKFEELANQTGGKAFTAENASEVVDAILEALEEIKTKPIADANGPYLGYVDSPITFDGTGSYDLDGTIVSYEWDFDDDGEFDDATGATPLKTWNSTYFGNISLKITDNDGNEDVDSTTVTVREPEETIAVPNLTPIGLVALVGLLSVIAISKIRRREN